MDESAGVRGAVVDAIGQVGAPSSWSALEEVARADVNEHVRERARAALASLAVEDPARLLELARRDPTPLSRKWILSVLVSTHPIDALPLAAELLASSDRRERAAAMRAARRVLSVLPIARVIEDAERQPSLAQLARDVFVERLHSASNVELVSASRVEVLRHAALEALARRGDIDTLIDLVPSEGDVPDDALCMAIAAAANANAPELVSAKLEQFRSAATAEVVLDAISRKQYEASQHASASMMASAAKSQSEEIRTALSDIVRNEPDADGVRALATGASLAIGNFQHLRDRLRFGRLDRHDNDIVCARDSVSAKHAMLERRNDDELWLVDHSTNGTLVSGELVHRSERRVFHGAILEIGRVPFMVYLRDREGCPAYERPDWYASLVDAPEPVAIALRHALRHATGGLSHGVCVGFALEILIRLTTGLLARASSADPPGTSNRAWTMGIWRDACLAAAGELRNSAGVLGPFAESLRGRASVLGAAVEARNALAHQPARAASFILTHARHLSEALSELLALWKQFSVRLEVLKHDGTGVLRSSFVAAADHWRRSSHPWCFVDADGALVVPRRRVKPGERAPADVFAHGIAETKLVTIERA